MNQPKQDQEHDQDHDQEQEEGQWANLSNDVLALILNHFQTQSDLCRFRSICKSWRCFSTPIQPHLLFPLSLPPLPPNSRPFSLSPTQLFLFSKNPNPNCRNGAVWLVKVEEIGTQKWALLNPLTNQKLYSPSGYLPNSINLMEFRNHEVGRSYKIQLVGPSCEEEGKRFDFEGFSSIALRKVAVKTVEGVVVLALYGYGQIAVWRSSGGGDKEWKVMDTGMSDAEKKESHFDDVVCFDGKFYAVDRRGRLAVIDPTTLELVDAVGPMEGCYNQYQYVYLVESRFRLYLVNKIVNPRPVNYYDEEEEEWVVDKTSMGKPVGFKVFVFDEKEKRWEAVESLGDMVFFVSRDAAFSVKAEDLGWSEGNCIYFEGLTGYDDEADLGFGLNAGVYSLDDKVITTFSSLEDPRTRIFRPPSSWIDPECEMS